MSNLDYLISRDDLLAWHKYDAASSANGNINDASGNGRHIVQASTPPILTADAWKGRHGWVFDGAANPLQWSGSISPKHVFVIAAYEEDTFDTNRGLLSGLTSGDWLTTVNDGATFFTFGAAYDYWKNDRSYDDDEWAAPTGLVPAVIEVTHPTGISMDGIQVGQQKADTARKFKGIFYEQFLYEAIQPEVFRMMLFEYAAAKFKLWREDAEGRYVWPFDPDWSRQMTADKIVLNSTTVSGTIKSRAKSFAKIGVEAAFSNRSAAEYDAAYTFWDDHYPGTPFAYHDRGFDPPREMVLRFTSGLGMQQQNYNDINYTWRTLSDNIEDSFDGGSIPEGALVFEDEAVVFSDED